MVASGRAVLAGGALVLAGCTDAATRIAYDLEAGAKSLRASPESRATIVVKCDGHGLYYTTYHLNFVVVPATVGVRKAAGEPVLLQLEKRGGDIALTEVR